MTHFVRRHRCAALALLVLLLVTASCSDPGVKLPTALDEPLFAEGQVTTTLVPGHRLDLPSGSGANRFLRGWWPIRTPAGPRHVPWTGDASLQLVRLRPKRARIHLPAQFAADVSIRAHVGERALDVTNDARRILIELPADLGIGRHKVDLSFEPKEPLVEVRGAVVRPRRTSGEATIDDQGVCLAGDVLLEQIRDLPGTGSRIVGRFDGPKDLSGRRFAMRASAADRAGQPDTEWSEMDDGAIDLDLGDYEGPVRIQLLAVGEGDAGCWRDLNLRHLSATEDASGSPAALRGSSPPPPPPEPVRPKLVMLYVMDALRADFVGHVAAAHGQHTRWPAPLSPNLDRIASEGTTFLSHYSVAPNTLPSTKALFTGRTFVDRGGWKLPADSGPTLAELIHESGYQTAMFSANEYVGPAFGTARGFSFVAPDTYFAATGRDQVNDSSERVHDAAIRWLDTVDPEAPVFLYLHTLNPHNPYRPPGEWADRFTRDLESSIDGSTETLLDIQHRRHEADAADQQRLRALYAASVAYNDAELGKLLSILETRYDPHEMVLAFTSDHGEELFEHDGVLHGYTLYREMLNIPLVIWSPGRVAVQQIHTPTDTLDLFVGLLELTRATLPPSAQGRSLASVLGGGDLAGNTRFASAASVDGGIFAAHNRQRKVIWAPRTGHGWGMGNGLGRSYEGEYVFDLEQDVAEQSNQVGRNDLEVDRLRSQLYDWVNRGRSRDQAAEPLIDPETQRNLEALGYIGN